MDDTRTRCSHMGCALVWNPEEKSWDCPCYESRFEMCESDYRFMKVIWENESISSGKLVELCAKKMIWKKSTMYTTLKNFVRKDLHKIRIRLSHQ
ncbi:MAG: BlaI/MecI/CopY family transcriptional regulator [Lachnospiraceae bacterium]|nr:BlaI/MecI/CopY family transcriptional regulator [Lachnospiraceae bacterium]